MIIRIILSIVLAMAFLTLDLALPLGVTGGVPYVALVLVGSWHADNRAIFLLAMISSILTIVSYYFSPEGGVPWIVLTNRASALFAIWITAIVLSVARRPKEHVKRSNVNLHHAHVTDMQLAGKPLR